MAHYAILDEKNVVVNVIVGRDEDDLPEGITSWEDYYGTVFRATVKRTSYNTVNGIHYSSDENGELVVSGDQSKALRFNYAIIGGTYNQEHDVFVPPKPGKINLDDTEWTLDDTIHDWVQAK